MAAPSPTWSTLDRGDTTVAVCRWEGADPPRSVVVIAHGASEHAGRYARLASALTGDGHVVYGIDHRGHGRTAADHGTPGVARPGGWEAMVTDLEALVDDAAAAHPDLPVILLGHSMGSFLAQRVMQRRGDRLAAVVLSGTSGGLEGADDLAPLLAAVEAEQGAEAPSELFAGMFAGFNEAFAGTVDEPTGFEWLSRDADEVATYVADPWCGGPLSNGFVTDMTTGTRALWQPEAEAGIPAGLPILLIAGDHDPVGDNGVSVRALAERYEAAGKGPVTLRLYPDARHEVVNETNRDEVTADLRSWLDGVR